MSIQGRLGSKPPRAGRPDFEYEEQTPPQPPVSTHLFTCLPQNKMPDPKPTILIVHGAWHHPAYFSSVISLLKAQGYDAI
jgi:alpha-beta hydrolase superfamily lysophospholipase